MLGSRYGRGVDDADLPVRLPRLNYSDSFRADGDPAGFSVAEFWAWALGDLRMNNARGFLAEYLVARAVRSEAPMRVEWAPHDVEGRDGTLIEVKASGYSQSWRGPDSKPSYSFKSVRSTQVWDERLGAYRTVDPADRVHVWVFALHSARRSDAYDALDIDFWSFRVVPHAWLLGSDQTSAGLSFFDRHGIEMVGWRGLSEAVVTARAEHDRLRTAA